MSKRKKINKSPFGRRTNKQPHHPKASMKLNPDDLPDVECVNPECDGQIFVPCMTIKYISAIRNPHESNPAYAMNQTVMCNRCHTLVPHQNKYQELIDKKHSKEVEPSEQQSDDTTESPDTEDSQRETISILHPQGKKNIPGPTSSS